MGGFWWGLANLEAVIVGLLDEGDVGLVQSEGEERSQREQVRCALRRRSRVTG